MSSQISPQDAAKELLARRSARKSLIDFTRYTLDTFQPGEHHKRIADALERVERGECKRLMIFAPPRHTKSELASRRFPAWYLGRNPSKQIICSTYGHDFAADFGRDVRGILANPLYTNLFDVSLRSDSKSANRWHTDKGGVYISTGVGGAITGRGADLALIDDPVKNRDEADSEVFRDRVWKWYTSTLYTRLMPGGSIVCIMCMTGDTNVLMADGTEKPLKDIRPGDEIATYDKGVLTTSTIKNWINNGPDFCYQIKMTSGKILKANERHPFLVNDNGEPKWIRLKNLRQGQEIFQVNGENGKVKLAHGMVVKRQLDVEATAIRTTIKSGGLMVLGRRLAKKIRHLGSALSLSIDTELIWRSIKGYLGASLADALYAEGALKKLETQSTGTTSYVSTIATKQGKLEGFFATIATWLSEEGKRQKSLREPPNTSDFTVDTIESIEPIGYEDVFDIQVERTENFIANGYVSHNTRWHEDDLAGRLLEDAKNGGDQWEVIDLKAIEDEGTENERALWPEWYDLEALKGIRRAIGIRDWGALYQQEPKPIEGTLFKREWFQRFNLGDEPELMNKYLSSDYGVTADGDFTELGVFGVDIGFNLWALDWWSGQKTPDVWIEELLRLADYHKVMCSFGESGVIRRAIEPFLVKRMQQTRTFFRQEWLTRTTNKIAMARGFQALAASGKVHIPYCEWGDRLINQLCEFPAAKYDDAVDVCALIGLALQDQHEAIAPPAPRPVKRDTWGRERTTNSWRV